MTVVAFTTVTLAAEAPPILTFVTPFKFAPTTVISVPPTAEPVFGLIDRIAGDASYVKPLPRLVVPPGVVSETVFGPSVPGGVTAVTVVLFKTTTALASAPSTLTLLVPFRFAPEIERVVPPPVDPEFGTMAVMLGGDR